MPQRRARYGCRLLPALLATAVAAASASTPVPELALDNGTLRVVATPALGGRVLSLQRAGRPNLLKVGDAVLQQPRPQVSAQADDIAYLAHDVWVGPQSQWWIHQQANPQRARERANWPPDPYLSFATTRIVRQDRRQLLLEGVDSPVSGVRLSKRIALSPERADTVDVEASARNIRDCDVAWDLWFNTRVSAATRVFVPVAGAADIRVQPAQGAATPLPARLESGLFVLDAATPDDAVHRGKFLLQPSAGWMAGFADGQVLVIRFAHQPAARIHPEQGQVELYLDAPAHAPASGLLEMEVHAPYRRLRPGERMQAAERWTVLRYDGADDVPSQRRFLCSQAQELGLAGACTR
ncbi:MAG TPA: DUF4380 domain-containing protein [Xanthomonadaceae bacterium]|nr:DUF4380 domain-containing protein [Xanthomonadaceae bacterium]